MQYCPLTRELDRKAATKGNVQYNFIELKHQACLKPFKVEECNFETFSVELWKEHKIILEN